MDCIRLSVERYKQSQLDHQTLWRPGARLTNGSADKCRLRPVFLRSVGRFAVPP